jgi:hypothetical protein
LDKFKSTFAVLLGVSAIVVLTLAGYQAMNDKLESAGVLAGFFVASAILSYLPQLELIKAFGIEARLSRTLDRAEEIINALQKTRRPTRG